MFWGVTLENGKRYTQTVDSSFHVSMAAMECSATAKNVSVMVEHNKTEFLLCSLNLQTLPQQALDLNFIEGEEVSFFVNGTGTVHLTGYLIDSDDMINSDAEDDSDEDMSSDDNLKRKQNDVGKEFAKKKKTELSNEFSFNDNLTSTDDEPEVDDDADFEDDDKDLFMKLPAKSPQKSPERKKLGFQSPAQIEPKNSKTPVESVSKKNKLSVKKRTSTPFPKSANKSSPENTTVFESANESLAINNGSQEETTKKKRKKRKSKAQNVSMESVTNNDAEGTVSTGKKSPRGSNDTSAKSSPQKKPGGTMINDLTIGSGQMAKQGKFVHISYEGKLPNNQVFDSSKNSLLKFRLGKGEVIKGMDAGVEGMKVGGKRKIVIPPNQGYGNKKLKGIPPNSTLIFEVELKAVS